MRLRLAATALSAAMTGLLAFGLPAAAQEQRQQAQFDLVVRGISIGNLSYASVQNGNSYALTGRVQTSGLAGMLRKMRYDASAQGRVTKQGLASTRYEQSGGSGSRTTREVLVWKSGVPRLEKQEPPRAAREGALDPAKQRGTVDTLTAIYVTLRDVPKGQECGQSLTLYDGRYRMALRMGKAQADGKGGTYCNGEYIRQGGFSAEEMAERTSFPFTLFYAPSEGDMMRVREVGMESLWGRARLVRR